VGLDGCCDKPREVPRECAGDECAGRPRSSDHSCSGPSASITHFQFFVIGSLLSFMLLPWDTSGGTVMRKHCPSGAEHNSFSPACALSGSTMDIVLSDASSGICNGKKGPKQSPRG